MYRLRAIKLPITIALLALSLLVAACGPSADVASGPAGAGVGDTGAAARLNKQGNKAFAEGTYDQALASYRKAQEKAPGLAEPYYNGSNALYRQGAYPEAGEQMKQALNQAESEALAQGGQYNLGNVSYQNQEWEVAVQAYKQALLLDPDDKDAKYNLELALQQLQQQEQQQEQEQQQNEGNGEQEPQDQQNQQDQQDQQQQEQNQQGDPQDHKDQQDQSSEGSTEPQEQDQDPNQDQQGGGGQPENQGDEQGEPPLQPGQRMTSEQARQLLAAVAQDAETLQERLGQVFRVPNRPPVQDW